MSLQSTYQTCKNTLASNLTTQGVTASGFEGLTTLIGKVLDISGTTPPGTFTDLQNLIDNATAGDTIILSKDYKYDSVADSGLTGNSKISITKALTIEGNGHIIDGNNQVKILRIETSGATVNLFNLTLQNALAPSNQNAGALIIYQATVNIYNTNFINNNGTKDGMGIFSANNTNYTVTINNCSFVGNTSSNGQGGAINIASGTWTIKNCIFKNNSANTYADIYSTKSITVYDCDITNINTTCYNVTNVECEGVTVSNLTLTSNKTTLSYLDSDTATLTATATDSNNNAVPNAKILFIQDNTVLSTETTNSNGVATYTYSSANKGDTQIYAVTNNAMDDITIEDCYYYHSASITYTNSSTDVYSALCTGVESIMTNNFSLEFQIRNNSGTGGVLNVGATTQYSPTGNSANYRMSIGIDSGSTNFNNRTNTSSATSGMSISNGTWYTLKMVKYEELYRAYNEGTLFSTKTPTWISNYSNYDLYFIGWSNCNMDVKEIKLKVIP